MYCFSVIIKLSNAAGYVWKFYDVYKMHDDITADFDVPTTLSIKPTS